ncbi:recombinase family protein [Haliangium ochraceum]|uniref:Resolvase domain protein n=1 Tax=Haliangium ochraceum (strain DSM 14365 / JCM 11303 / SMP-2) TaxID=502025 RepID=D0LPD9_HALO1|nr:recombinase family protein [Haliangium ochraceum]ACY13504.1 Resolvase domain protein [Haliangium ochraceum DSM 14365]
MSRRKPKESAPAAPSKRAAIYTRKSTGKGLDRDFNSLDAQREACEQYIKSQAHQGWQLVATHYDDGGFTGANIDRPAFARLLRDVDAGRIDVVVVYKADRLSRSLLDFANVISRFNKTDTAFVAVTQNFSTADAIGRLTLNILMSFAEFEREMISERTRDKVAGSRKRGKWTGGPLPVGYASRDKKLVVVEREARIVREIFARYLRGDSVFEIARYLNESGRRKPGRTSRTGHVLAKREWDKGSVLRALKNPVYAGFMRFGGELFEGEHKAIIDRESFEQAAARLAANCVSSAPKVPRDDYVLSGRLFCVLCGSAMTPKSTTKRRTGKLYRYYQCVVKDKSGHDACRARPLPAAGIEAYVVERIRVVTAGGALARDVAARVEAHAARRRAELLAERTARASEIAVRSADGHALLDTLVGLDASARRLVEGRLGEIGRTVAEAERELAEAERALLALDEQQTEAQWTASTLEHFADVWKVMTPGNRIRLVQALVRRIEVNEPRQEIRVVLHDLEFEHGEDEHAEAGTAQAAEAYA